MPGRRKYGKRKFAEIGVTLDLDEEPHNVQEEEFVPEVPDVPDGYQDNDVDMDDILKLVDNAPDVPELDLGGLGVLVSKFEACVQKNERMRVKYSEKPARFMSSELELHKAIKSLHQLATAPLLYEKFSKMGAMKVLINLLSHENTDIALAVIDAFHEFTDPSTIAEDEGTIIFVDCFVELGMELLIQNLNRLGGGSEDNQGVYHILNILDNMAEVDPDYCTKICTRTKILNFLLARIRGGKFGEITTYCAEILSIFVQAAGDDIKLTLGKLGAITVALDALNEFSLRDLRNEEEIEFCNNLCDVLANIFTLGENRLKYYGPKVASGTLLHLIRKKKEVKSSALRALNLALTDCRQNCSAFVAAKGLKVLFASFMRKERMYKKKSVSAEDSNEENIVSILVNLFVNLSDVEYARLLRKFFESDYEKIDRLIELHDKYLDRLEDAKRKQKTQNEDEEDEMLKQMDNGLFTLQLIDLVVGFVCTAGDEGMKKRIHQVLHQQDSDIDDVKKVLQGLLDSIGEDRKGPTFLKPLLISSIINML